MEILECGEGDVLVIDQNIVLSVVEVTDDEVYLKIEFPEGVQVNVEDLHHHVI